MIAEKEGMGMICVGFCDDEMEVQLQFLLLLNQYRSSHSCEICCKTFCSPLDLLAEVERGTRFDILFLDVLMPGQNGIHAAQEIRNVDSNVKIIFLRYIYCHDILSSLSILEYTNR